MKKELTIEEELTVCRERRKRDKRKRRDLMFFVAMFVIALAMAGLELLGFNMITFVCVECSKERAKGCTLIAEDGDRLPLICVRKEDRTVITCQWLEVPKKKDPYFMEE